MEGPTDMNDDIFNKTVSQDSGINATSEEYVTVKDVTTIQYGTKIYQGNGSATSIIPNMNDSVVEQTSQQTLWKSTGEWMPSLANILDSTTTDANPMARNISINGSLANQTIVSKYDKTEVSLVLLTLCVTICLLTIIGNVLIIVAVRIDLRLRKPNNLLIISLALADLIVGLVVMPCFSVYVVLGYWPLGGLMCDVWISLDFMCCTASMLNLCAIAYDRYIAVSKPLRHLKSRSKRKALQWIAMVWITSAICWIPAIVVWRMISGDSGNYECLYLPHPIYVLVSSLLIYDVPILVMVVLIIMIYVKVRQKLMKNTALFQRTLSSRKTTRNNATSGTSATDIDAEMMDTDVIVTKLDTRSLAENAFSKGSQRLSKTLQSVTITNEYSFQNACMETRENGETNETIEKNDVAQRSNFKNTAEVYTINLEYGEELERHRRHVNISRRLTMHKRTANTLGMLIVVFLACWLLFVILFPVNAYCDCVPIDLYNASYWLAYINSALNPCLYVFVNQDFRRAFRKIFCRFRTMSNTSADRDHTHGSPSPQGADV
ncbi:alpha-2Db adrenergic receptor-like [Ptychodera flava]|uniref:alpha-2Db adrenergic receptor-like n=1 Tax=Ptychodera flava TaxID=63121 RepID=UPI00396A36B5